MMPLISVIIPAYNAESTIKQTIESVINQIFSDFELIIIDDGSNDSTLDIINSILDSRIKVFSYPNSGAQTSRNRGIAQAHGKYIAFLDADDLWTEDKLESQLKALENNPEATVAYSWTDYINEAGNWLYPGTHLSINGNVYQDLLVHNFIENGSNPLILREALDQVGYFDESLIGGQDWDMWLRLAQDYHFVAVSRPQILYRQPSNSISANVLRQERECLKVIDKAYSQAPASLQQFKKASLANLYQYLMFKTLETQKSQESYRIAANFCLKMLRYKPMVIVERSRLMAITIVKIMLGMVLPSRYYQYLWQLLRKHK